MVVANVVEALDIDGDDSVDIVVAVEQAFGIKITDSEAEACQTVGDLFRVICAHVPTVERSDAIPCLTAATFRELRRVIRLIEPSLDLRPATLLSSFAGHHDHREWHAHLKNTSGLSVPDPSLTVPSMVGGLTLYGIAAAGAVATFGHDAAGFFVAALLAPAAGFIVHSYGRRTWDANRTLGDLARETAAYSLGQIAKAHGAVRTRELWEALVIVLRPFSRHTGLFAHETRFFAKQK
ncbi:acyl carrier protein [Enterovirga aerilata]|uniref:Acyl carrier protein n=1 Tax=Enterovirga aerilata TaxID=2730920 RepID=A0A849I6H8_9HYPH|nr:acyl carrier protein [Enterovirga sp. DB1703]NNM73304.1 acyl carrier protein [Enterovirga sp. DB1703]